MMNLKTLAWDKQTVKVDWKTTMDALTCKIVKICNVRSKFQFTKSLLTFVFNFTVRYILHIIIISHLYFMTYLAEAIQCIHMGQSNPQ